MEFIDLRSQHFRIKDRIDSRIAAVLEHGRFISGPEVAELEDRLAAHCGARHAIGCANGTDALQLAMMALDIGTGDAVFVPAFTFAASAEAVSLVGATPVFVDIDPISYHMSIGSLARALARAVELNLVPRAVMPVDLFGLPADYEVIEPFAEQHELSVLCDSAQGWGGKRANRITGCFGDITATSFFPAKPLGCYGDGGAIFTNSDDLAEAICSMREHGRGAEKYDNARIGMNSRLDTIQAAILLEKLELFPGEVEARQQVAARYSEALAGTFKTPTVPEGCVSVWAQYTLKMPSETARDATRAFLSAQKVPTMVYYPRPLHQQMAYRNFPRDPEGLFEAERAARRVFSIPMSPYLTRDDQDIVISALLAAAESGTLDG